MAPDRIGARIRLLSFCAHAWGKQRAGIAYYCWNPTGYSVKREPFFPSKTLHLATYMWSSAGIQAQSDTPFLQNNNNKPKSNLTTETTPIGVTNVQGPSPASFPTVLFITFPSLTYSPQLLLPSPLLSAWNRHSRKYILCKLSSCCYSWFHKWWRNGQESERGKWKKMAVARYDHIPLLSFFIDNRGWFENSRWEGQH